MKIKRLVSLLVSLAMTISTFAGLSITANAAEVEPDYLTFTGTGAFELDIPAYLTQKSNGKVTKLAWYTALTKSETTSKLEYATLDDSGEITGWESVMGTDNQYEDTTGHDSYNITKYKISSGKDNKLFLRGENLNSLSGITSHVPANWSFQTADEDTTVAASGDIMTLFDYNNPRDVTLANYALSFMFYNTKKLTTAPKITAKKLPYYGASNMYYLCEDLEYAPDFPADCELVDSSCSSCLILPS